MRYKLVRYVGKESGWDVTYALEHPDGTLERVSPGPRSAIKIFAHSRDTFAYVKQQSGATRDSPGDPSYCITWEGSTY